MRSWLFLFVLVLATVGTASAYSISITAPTTLYSGEPLLVNGTSNLPPGTSVDIVFARELASSKELDRVTVTLQGERIPFNISFITTGYPGGQYKVEVMPIAGFSFLSDSVSLRPLRIIERSGEISLSSPLEQYPAGALQVDGYLTGNHKNGCRVEVRGPDNDTLVFGPADLATDTNGYFSQKIPVPGPGMYRASLSDDHGYIGTIDFTVLGYEGSGEPANTTASPPATLESGTVTAGTVTPPENDQEPALSVSAESSRDNPAFFAVTSREEGTTRLYTSRGMDWVIEYTDRSGNRVTVNDKGPAGREEMELPGDGNVTYLEIRPYKYQESGTVTLFAEHAGKLEIYPQAAAMFPETLQERTNPIHTASPLPVSLAVAGVIAAILVIAARRR